MHRPTLLAVAILALPAALSAQQLSGRYTAAGPLLDETRHIVLLPNEVVGFRITGTSEQARNLRVTTGHLLEGRLYHAVAVLTPRDGSTPIRAEGTLSHGSPELNVGTLADGEYVVTIHLEDLATGDVRDAKNKVVLR
jgi:hypothetical protein